MLRARTYKAIAFFNYFSCRIRYRIQFIFKLSDKEKTDFKISVNVHKRFDKFIDALVFHDASDKKECKSVIILYLPEFFCISIFPTPILHIYSTHIAIAQNPHRLPCYVSLQIIHNPLSFRDYVRSTGTCQPICKHQDFASYSGRCRPNQSCKCMHPPWHSCNPGGHHTQQPGFGCHGMNNVRPLFMKDLYQSPQRHNIL